MKYGTSIQKKNITKKQTKKTKQNEIKKINPIKLITVIFILEIFLYTIFSLTNHENILFIGLTSLITIFFIIRAKKKKKIDTEDLIYFLIIIGILIRNLYIAKTPIPLRQHDVAVKDGHLNYIYHLFQTHTFPTTNNEQFYHPPLHHIIAAIWLQIGKIIGLGRDQAIDSIKILTLFYSTLTMIYIKKIIDKIKIKDIYKIIALSILIFHPTFILLSASINNDCLVIALMVMATYYLLKWYEDPSRKNTIILALITGLSVMTKSNGALLSVPILFIFIKKWFEDKKENGKWSLNYFKQFILFGIISLPIGLWFQIRQYIIFGYYKIPVLAKYNISDHYSLFKRFLTLDINSFIESPFCIKIKNELVEHNIITYTIKCSIFGEYKYTFIKLFSYSFLLVNTVLIVISLFYLFKYIIKKNNKNLVCNILLITWITHIISFIIFNLQYPYGCTMDTRYIVPCLLTGIIIPAYELQKTKKWIKYTCLTLSILFILLSIGFVLYI